MKLFPALPLAVIALLVILSSVLRAGEVDAAEYLPASKEDAFASARQPMTNSTLFDLTLPQTHIHPLFFYHNLPDRMNLAGGGSIPVGGDVQLYALQFEIALSDRLSINATKDGYIVMDPSATLADQEGWGNIAAGLKYLWLHNPEDQLASNVQLIFEAPLGSSDVFQGEGDGVFIPSASVLKIWDRWQVIDQFGFKLPIDGDEESTSFYNSFHVSYELTDWLFPLFEVNWFHVIDGGNGGARFGGQAGGAVPGIIGFEGSDVFNFGALDAGIEEDLVTLGVGFRARLPKRDHIDIGFAYEFPVTDDSDSIFKNRFVLDAVIRF